MFPFFIGWSYTISRKRFRCLHNPQPVLALCRCWVRERFLVPQFFNNNSNCFSLQLGRPSPASVLSALGRRCLSSNQYHFIFKFHFYHFYWFCSFLKRWHDQKPPRQERPPVLILIHGVTTIFSTMITSITIIKAYSTNVIAYWLYVQREPV